MDCLTESKIRHTMQVLEAALEGKQIQKTTDRGSSLKPSYTTVDPANLYFLGDYLRIKPEPRPYTGLAEFIEKGYIMSGGTSKKIRFRDDVTGNTYDIFRILEDGVQLHNTSMANGVVLNVSYQDLCSKFCWVNGGLYCGIVID